MCYVYCMDSDVINGKVIPYHYKRSNTKRMKYEE